MFPSKPVVDDDVRCYQNHASSLWNSHLCCSFQEKYFVVGVFMNQDRSKRREEGKTERNRIFSICSFPWRLGGIFFPLQSPPMRCLAGGKFRRIRVLEGQMIGDVCGSRQH